MAHHSRYADTRPYRTKDGSTIRELMHPAVHGNVRQSLAEATVAPGERTMLHRHQQTEELYHVTAGQGCLTLGDIEVDMKPGDTACIPPGTPHRIQNTGDVDLVILCSCAPAYSHDDTEMME